MSSVKHYKAVLSSLEQTLKERGLARYFTMAESSNDFRFNEIMGFKTIYEVWDNRYEIMVKEL